MTDRPATRRRALGALATGIAAAVVLAAVVVHLDRAARVTSWAAASELAAGLGLAAVIALLAAGGLTLLLTGGPDGVPCLLLAVGWVAPVFVGWEGGPPALRAVATIGQVLMVPLLVHVAVVAQGDPSRPWRMGVGAGYAVVGCLGVAVVAVHNPFLDLDSWSNLSDFAFVAVEPTLSEALVRWSRVAVVTVGAIGLLLVLARAVRTRRGVPVWGAALVALAGEAAYAVLMLRQPLERFETTAGLLTVLLRGAALLALGLAVAWRADARRRLLRRMARLITDLAQRPPAGTLEQALRSALRDEGVQVRYWIREREEYVDSDGRPRPDPETGERAAARIVRGDEPVALVTYDPERLGEAYLEQQLGATARLAFDNERLRAESLAHVDDLIDSRSRVVAVADQQRRTLERDLHDGAQQRLLAVLLELRLARPAKAAQQVSSIRLDAAVGEATGVLAELRDVAHGVFPAVLDESGLEQALWSLTDRSRVPVETVVALDGNERSAAVDRAVYLIAKAVIDGALDDLVLDVTGRDGRLELVATGVGEVDAVHLADRVGAVGGELRRHGGRLEAVIPCE